MAKGARLYPLQVTKLYEKIVGIVDSKRKTPTRFYYKVKGGKNYIERYTDEQIWCRDFLTFVRNREDFERFLNDIADSQWMSVLTAMQRVDRDIDVPSFGRHWIHPETYQIYAECGFDFNKMTSLGHEYMKERHRKFYERLRAKRFLKLTDKAAYDADYTQRLVDILRRGKA